MCWYDNTTMTVLHDDNADEMFSKGNALFSPIGVIRSPFLQPTGTPIQASVSGGAEGRVELFEAFEAGLKDLESFERIWLIYYFDRIKEPHPRLGRGTGDQQPG
jgi:tRNA (Thr-GGU) A37 N-methylase